MNKIFPPDFLNILFQTKGYFPKLILIKFLIIDNTSRKEIDSRKLGELIGVFFLINFKVYIILGIFLILSNKALYDFLISQNILDD